MNILQIATQVTVPQSDGGKKFVFGITKYLHSLGHQVDFICYRRNDNYNFAYKELSKVCIPHILDVQTDNSIIFAILNLFSPLPYNVSKFKTKILKKYLIKLLSQKQFDIIQIEHSHLGWLTGLIKAYSKARLVIRAPNLELRIMERFYKNQKNPFLRKYAEIQYKKALKYEPSIYSNFDLCIMISKTDQEELLKLNPDVRSTVIPSGIEFDLLKYEKKNVIPFSLIHVGHTDWFPNFDSLSWFIKEIFTPLINKYPQCILYVYGGGNTKNFPIPKELDRNIKIIGYVENLWQEIQDKALAVVPLRIGGGIRIKILEFLATGQIIITTSIGKEGIDVANMQHLIIADTSKEFIQRIIDLFENRIDTDKMIINGKNYIRENYIWQVIAKRIENEYKNLIKDS